MNDTLHLIAKLMHAEVTFIEDQTRLRPQNSEVFRLWGDNQKIRKLTGYIPEYSMERGLRETIDWFQSPEHLNQYKTNIYNI
jgi:nucleoside-diphosphate-sugar epimerase